MTTHRKANGPLSDGGERRVSPGHLLPLMREAARRFLPAAVGIAVASLSVHVVMLQVLHVPYPDMAGIGRLGLVLVVLRVMALMVVYRLFRPAIAHLSVAVQIVAVALLDTMVAGNLRSAMMEAVVTTSLAFPSIKLLLQLAQSLVLAALVIGAQRMMRRPAAVAGTAIVVTAAMTFLVAPVAQAVVGRFAGLRGAEIYREPYGIYVLSWSYLTFIETVAAVIAIAFLIGGRLSARPLVGLVQFAALVLLLRGTLVMQLLFPWLMRGEPAASALSTSQFFLQDLVMAVLVWLLWRRTRAVRDLDR